MKKFWWRFTAKIENLRTSIDDIWSRVVLFGIIGCRKSWFRRVENKLQDNLMNKLKTSRDETNIVRLYNVPSKKEK